MKKLMMLMPALLLSGMLCGATFKNHAKRHNPKATDKVVTTTVGKDFSVHVEQQAGSTGFMPMLKTYPAFVEPVGEAEMTAPAVMPGFTGGVGSMTFNFKAKAAGRGVIVIELRRSWEPADTPPAKQWQFIVVVTAKKHHAAAKPAQPDYTDTIVHHGKPVYTR